MFNDPTIMLQRGPITDAVIGVAGTIGKPIGDAEMPRGGVAGWQGAPNTDGTNFIPYSVVTPMNTQMGTGPLGDPQGDLTVVYGITSYGVSRQQCEWMSDAVRSALGGLANTQVIMYSGTSRQHVRIIQYVMDQQIGQVQRVSDTDPAYYGQTDVVALWTTR